MRAQRNIGNLLVTGGAGFIGSAFIRYLLSSQCHFEGTCVNLDLLTYAGNLENLSSIDKDPRYIFQQGDINDESLVESLCQQHGINTIIHFAAESHVDRSIDRPQSFIETNVLGTFHLLEVVRRYPHLHFHHVSTDEVYGSLGTKGYFSEDTPYSPNSPYSASKASSDHLVRAYIHTYGISACISNCSNNYGPYQFPEKFVPSMILCSLQRKPLPVYGNGINVRDWLFVEDHVNALYLLLQCAKNGETYDIGGEEEWRNIDLVYEIIHIIANLQHIDQSTLEKLISFVPDRPGHDLRYAINCKKIKKEIGWKPQHTFSEGLAYTINWYMNHQEWIDHILKRHQHFIAIQEK